MNKIKNKIINERSRKDSNGKIIYLYQEFNNKIEETTYIKWKSRKFIRKNKKK